MNPGRNILSRGWQWLTKSTIRPARTNTAELYKLDELQIAKDLNLLQEAARLGSVGLPAPSSVGLSGPEQQIVARIERARLDYTDWATTRISLLSEDWSRLDVTPAVNRALQTAEEFSRTAGALLGEREPLIRALARESQQFKKELDEFKQRNELTRDADYPTGANVFYLKSIFLVLILVEGLANSFFFAQGVSNGLIGGFISAALFAALNVSIAGAHGRYAIPLVFHRKMTVKITGLIFCLTALAFMLSIGLAISHYRDAMIADVSSPAVTAYQTLRDTPLILADIMSWFLFAMSVSFGVLGVFDGLFLSDRYPFYAGKTKRYIRAHTELEDELHLLRQDLAELKENSIAALDREAQQVRNILVRQEGIVQAKEDTRKKLESALQGAEHCMKSLLGLFRTENQVHRKGVAIPPTFNEIPKLETVSNINVNVLEHKEMFNSQHRAASHLIQETEVLRAEVQAAFNREYDRLQPLVPQLHDAAVIPKLLTESQQ